MVRSKLTTKVRLYNINNVFVFIKQCQEVYYTYTPSFRKDNLRVDWLSILKTKPKSRIKVVQDENDISNVKDDVFQISELVEPYRVSPLFDFEENSKFCVFDNIFVNVDTKKLNVVLSYSGQA